MPWLLGADFVALVRRQVTQSKYVVCQFYHNGFERCKIVDKHLSLLAP